MQRPANQICDDITYWLTDWLTDWSIPNLLIWSPIEQLSIHLKFDWLATKVRLQGDLQTTYKPVHTIRILTLPPPPPHDQLTANQDTVDPSLN